MKFMPSRLWSSAPSPRRPATVTLRRTMAPMAMLSARRAPPSRCRWRSRPGTCRSAPPCRCRPRARRPRSARWWSRRCRRAPERSRRRPSMRASKWPSPAFCSVTVARPSSIADGQRAAGHEAGGHAAGDVLQFVAVLVAGDEREDDQRPQAEAARHSPKRWRRAEDAGGRARCRARRDRSGGQSGRRGRRSRARRRPAGRPARCDDAERDDQRIRRASALVALARHAAAPRFAARRRSTVSSRAGSCAITARRSTGVMPIHAGDLVARAPAAEAIAGLDIDRADEDAGRFDGRSSRFHGSHSTWDAAAGDASPPATRLVPPAHRG